MGSLRGSLLNVDTWLKIVFILLFWVLLSVVSWVLGAVVFVQILIALITGERNDQLVGFGKNLGTYLKQIVNFICFADDEKPFPFADFPSESSSRISSGTYSDDPEQEGTSA